MNRKNTSAKLNLLIGFVALIGLPMAGNTMADTLTVQCRVGQGRSSVALRNTGSHGKFFVQLFSGDENFFTSVEKVANKKKVIDFRFDSDPGENPDELIATGFIKKRELAVILRRAVTNANMGTVRLKCKPWRKMNTTTPP